ncbi:uncharacterized protein LOC122651074 [Telopea speciosissima]|uniref:uncharacterized protein LOC122651074 n=1 Tax=Telopea speciosissima TaxID=54955 RepID=UPI001CC42B32|nr:uncharacterized protein LOC122651074 [Telopea speciosissima]
MRFMCIKADGKQNIVKYGEMEGSNVDASGVLLVVAEGLMRWWVCNDGLSRGGVGLQGECWSCREGRWATTVEGARVVEKGLFTDSLAAAARSGDYDYHQYCDKPDITSVCFADDFKSSIFFANCLVEIKSFFQATTGFVEGSLPIKYLGVPLTSCALKANDFSELITKVEGKLTSWQARSLSFAGRLVLIKSVVMGCISYWLNVFRLPQFTVDLLERMIVRYLWKGNSSTGRHKVAWSVVCRPKQEGGLGLRSLRDGNTAALMRYVWSIASDEGTCWVKFVKERWLKRHSIWSLSIPMQCSGTFREILKTRDVAVSCVRYLITNGERTLLWTDPWLPKGPIYKPGLLLAEAVGRSTFDTVSFIRAEDDQWASPYLDTALQERSIEISQVRVHRGLGGDFAVWAPSPNGKFSLKSAWNVIQKRGDRVEWCNLKEAETIDHLFFHCDFSVAIWRKVLGLNGFERDPLATWKEEIQWLTLHFGGNTLVSRVRKFSFVATVYRIWLEQNTRVHQQVSSTSDSVLHQIVMDTRLRFSEVDGGVMDSSSNRDFLAGIVHHVEEVDFSISGLPEALSTHIRNDASGMTYYRL